MPANWSGSRTNLDRHLSDSSCHELTDVPSPFLAIPSLTSLSSGPKQPANENVPKRRIVINQKHKHPFLDSKQRPLQKFPPNRIRTSKYTLVTFIPKNLYEQFRGIANFYFLSLVILQAFSIFMTVSVAITAAPIIFIVLVTAIKVRVSFDKLFMGIGCSRRL